MRLLTLELTLLTTKNWIVIPTHRGTLDNTIIWLLYIPRDTQLNWLVFAYISKEFKSIKQAFNICLTLCGRWLNVWKRSEISVFSWLDYFTFFFFLKFWLQEIESKEVKQFKSVRTHLESISFSWYSFICHLKFFYPQNKTDENCNHF